MPIFARSLLRISVEGFVVHEARAESPLSVKPSGTCSIRRIACNVNGERHSAIRFETQSDGI